MRKFIVLLLLLIPGLAQDVSSPKLSADNGVRIKEFYRLAAEVQDGIWLGWSRIPAPLILVTPDGEFLTHHPAPPKEWKSVGDATYTRPRQFPPSFQATFPAFGPPAVMVVGEPANTASKASAPWLFMVMHEHFHQLQWAQPGFIDAVNALGLSRGDTSGMWMLNYPFPYEKPDVARGFVELRDLLMRTLGEWDDANLRKLARTYVEHRKKFFAQLLEDDRKYFSFQLWQEGIARYTEVKSSEGAAKYDPTAEFAALPDFEAFSSYAVRARANTLNELKQADLATWKRTVVYSFGAAEGMLLDRLRPGWKEQYFKRMLSTDSYFE